MKVTGGCHCGAVRFAAEVPPKVELLDCNCSICRKSGFLHLIVPEEAFALVQGAEALSSYRFGTGAAEHLFCAVCGVKSFYRPRSHPEGWSVNFRCLDEGAEIAFETREFDGAHWDAARARLADGKA